MNTIINNILVLILYFCALQILFINSAHAIDVSNNRLGVHILDPYEIDKASKFVNSNSKIWGYVVVPMRIDDRDLDKWQFFFNKTKELKIIPIIRLAMHADNQGGWAIPTDDEVYYSAKFLDQMDWPTKNRYVIVFNEPNHALEWGGRIDPVQYAERLNFAIDVFKSKNKDYFMLNAALDWAAPNSKATMSAKDYWNIMLNAYPEIATKIDGLNSHAYPNPGFKSPPTNNKSSGISTYKSELEILSKFGRNDVPIFITETNWTNKELLEDQIIKYWNKAWSDIWIEPEIMTISVWLLEANDGPFAEFSLYRDNAPTRIYEQLTLLPRDSGSPIFSIPSNISPTIVAKEAGQSGEKKDWWNFNVIDNFLKWITQIFDNSPKSSTSQIEFSNGKKIFVEIADTPQKIQTGLMNRTSLGADNGMLFILDGTTTNSFWMKNTLINLDMIWIRDDIIVDIHRDVPVEQDPSNPKYTYRPKHPANKVIEVNAGWTYTNNINIGDRVSYIDIKL